MKISQSTDDQLMITAAHRYCLGRQSYIVGACITFLTTHWNQLSSQTQMVILRDTIDEIMQNNAGSNYDLIEWVKFVNAKFKLCEKDEKEWVMNQVRNGIKGFDKFADKYGKGVG